MKEVSLVERIRIEKSSTETSLGERRPEHKEGRENRNEKMETFFWRMNKSCQAKPRRGPGKTRRGMGWG